MRLVPKFSKVVRVMITNNGLVPDFVLESFKFCDVYGSFFRKKLGYFQLSPQPHTRARGSQKANA